MLVGLAIRDIVLIDRLDLDLEGGLCVLTGETGAGKSILLDALGLAIGASANASLVAKDVDKGSVVAVFDVAPSHPAHTLLRQNDIQSEGEIILRRVQTRDGRTRAFINDESVSIGLLRQLGDLLVEIHGQHDERGLLNAVQHRGLLDAFAGHGDLLRATAESYDAWRQVQLRFEDLQNRVASGQAEIEFLRHAVDELNKLDPKDDEDSTLAEERQLMMNAERIGEALTQAQQSFETEGGAVEDKLSSALTVIERVASQAGDRLEPALNALSRALADLGDARGAVEAALVDLEFDPARLEFVEERLFALRAAARKHKVSVGDLSQTKAQLVERLAQVEDGDASLEDMRREVSHARTVYLDAAAKLSKSRHKAAAKLDTQVTNELKPLKLEKARFVTEISALDEEQAGPDGGDRVRFLVSTNPGAALAPMVKIASGGELARFILALKVALASRGSAPTLVFDEVDRGVGGAVAAAVGERLAQLAKDVQVLVVTHSPQVAARGGSHWRIEKSAGQGSGAGANEGEAGYVTTILALSEDARREEIARMLAGTTVTDEARAAAAKLIEQQA